MAGERFGLFKMPAYHNYRTVVRKNFSDFYATQKVTPGCGAASKVQICKHSVSFALHTGTVAISTKISININL
jgi:hypothetical protein